MSYLEKCRLNCLSLFEEDFHDLNAVASNNDTAPSDIPNLFEVVSKQCCLSSKGVALVSEWILMFKKKRKENEVVSLFAKHCKEAQSFFLSATQLEAAKLLLSILENMIKKTENEDNAVTLPISKSDNYILQYIGGYLIAKICKKFPNSFESASMGLCSQQSPDPDSLIFLLNRSPNALQVPSEEFLQLLIHVYYIFGKECSKRLISVDFNQVIGFALNSIQILRYIETLANQCDLS